MKKLVSMIALAAISFGSVYAHSTIRIGRSVVQMDTTKKKKMKTKTKTTKDSTKKKDTMLMKQK